MAYGMVLISLTRRRKRSDLTTFLTMVVIVRTHVATVTFTCHRKPTNGSLVGSMGLRIKGMKGHYGVPYSEPTDRITVAMLRCLARDLGMAYNRTDYDEHRVNFLCSSGGTEATACYTNDARDAWDTLHAMAGKAIQAELNTYKAWLKAGTT